MNRSAILTMDYWKPVSCMYIHTMVTVNQWDRVFRNDDEYDNDDYDDDVNDDEDDDDYDFMIKRPGLIPFVEKRCGCYSGDGCQPL